MNNFTLKHIAIIMDGNRRYARKQGLPLMKGHEHGANQIKNICKWVKAEGINTVTLFAFSSENWKREKKEVGNLLTLLQKFLMEESRHFIDQKIKIRVIGDLAPYKPDIQQSLKDLEEKTSAFIGFELVIALNYGGRGEILHAVNKLLHSKAQHVTEKDFTELLYTKGLPEPDLLIRTGGAIRISNFLLWQIAYTELFFSPKLWPEFGEADLKEAISFFYSQERNFGS